MRADRLVLSGADHCRGAEVVTGSTFAHLGRLVRMAGIRFEQAAAADSK